MITHVTVRYYPYLCVLLILLANLSVMLALTKRSSIEILSCNRRKLLTRNSIQQLPLSLLYSTTNTRTGDNDADKIKKSYKLGGIKRIVSSHSSSPTATLTVPSTPLAKVGTTNSSSKTGKSTGSNKEESDKKSKSKQTKVEISSNAKWETVQLGTNEDVESSEMDDRLKEASRWVSRKLSSDEAKLLERELGIEDELYDDDDDGVDSGNKKKEASKKKKSVSDRQDTSNKIGKLSASAEQAAARVKGFLEMNPFICSGCGTPFQSKSANTPGFLPKDKLQEHRSKAVTIREKQSAIRILELAGIEIDSDAAKEILEEANVSKEVIAAVRALGQSQAIMDNNYMRKTMSSSSSSSSSDDNDDDDDDDEFDDDVDEFGDDDDEFIDIEIDMDKMVEEEKLAKKSAINDIKYALLSLKNKDSTDTDTDTETDTDRSNDSSKSIGKDSLINDITVEVNRKSNRYMDLSDDEGIDEGIDEYINRKKSYSRGNTYNNKDKGNFDDDSSNNSVMKDPICICQRCFRLQQYGQVEESLRPGWSDHELLTPDRFESLLGVIKETKSVVLCLIDIFDLRGSLIPNLKAIAGNNPVVIAANKADLLPKDASTTRLINWIHAEVKEYCGLLSPKDTDENMSMTHSHSSQKKVAALTSEVGVLRRNNVHLVSCQSGFGMEGLIKSLINMASDHGNTIHVMGAANVGKSSLINRLLDTSYVKRSSKGSGSSSSSKRGIPLVTVSNLPGTTLDFLKIRLPNGVTMIDTPGLINKGQLTSKLTTAELKQIIPMKPINAVTLRVSEGKCVLIGGLAIIELLEGLPFYFTFFISNEVKLHPTNAVKAEEFIAKHVGTLVFPPNSIDRYHELGPFRTHVIDIDGAGWKAASTDIVIAGLGWVSITGSGSCKVKVTIPDGTSIATRPALLPYEAITSTASFTGGKINKRSKKSGAKAYGWRS